MAKKPQQDLAKKIEQARRKVDVGGLYTHYKDTKNLYLVEFVGLLEVTEELCVGYRSLYGKGILWVRSLKDFTEKIVIGKRKVQRFKKK